MSKRRRPSQEQVCGSGTGSYEVQSGDTMWDISRAGTGQGSNYDQIQNLDGSEVENPNLIHPGQMLDVSGVCSAGEEEVEAEDLGEAVAVDGAGVAAGLPSDGGGDAPPGETGAAGAQATQTGSGMAATQADTTAQTEPGQQGADVSLDDLLNDEASTERLTEVATEVDWIDELNAVRNNDIGKGGINAVERLIPFYGMYDGLRDNWNTTVNRLAHVPGDPVLNFIVLAEGAVGAVADVVRHLGYLFAIVQAIAAATGIGAVPATIGGYSIGLVINAILFVLDGINMLLGLAGAGWSALMLAVRDLDELDRARYEYMMVDQIEHTMVSGIHMVVDVAAGALANYLPSTALGQGARAGVALLAGGTGTGLRGVSTGVARYIMGEGSEATGFGQGAEPWFDPNTFSLPKDIVADVTYAAENPYPGIPGPTLFSDETRDRLMNGTERPGMTERTTMGQVLDPARWFSDPGPTLSSYGPMDYSPDQITALTLIEQDLTGALSSTDASAAALDAFATDQDATATAYQGAEAALTDMATRQQGVVSTVDSAMPGAQEGLTQQAATEQHMTDMVGQFGSLGGHLSDAVTRTSTQGEAPEQEDDRNFLERGADWVYDNTIGRLFDQLNEHISNGSTASSAALGQATSSQSAGGSAASTVSQEGAVAQEAIAGGEEAKAGASASATQLVAEASAIATAREAATVKAEEARGFADNARSDRAKLEANLLLVQTERQRQETSLAGFTTAMTPLLAGPSGMDLAQADLMLAWDMLSDLSDAAVAEVAAAAGGLPSIAAPAGAAIVQQFSDGEASRMAGLMSVLASANSASAVQTAVSRLLGAEASLIAARDHALAALDEAQRNTQGFDPNAPEQDGPRVAETDEPA